MPVVRFWQVQPPAERLQPHPGLPHTHPHMMLTYLRSHPTMVLMVPKADTSEHFTALLPPCPAFLGEEDDTTEKEPCQKTGSVPPFRKDTALRGLSAPLSLIPSSDITFLSSCRIHNMWTRVLRCNEGQGTLVATRLRYSVSNFLSRLLSKTLLQTRRLHLDLSLASLVGCT